ncbi:MAG: C40 family peptidase, partial [Cocleimonas sp.]|nr:C40 family peptidase [Cocleimonas sp.]
MRNISPLVGLIALAISTTACTPPQRHAKITQPHTTPPAQPYSQNPTYSPSHQARQSIVRLAYQELGTRYKFGGSSPREGFDCSGLMTYIHKNGASIKIPRTAAQQQNRSRTVNYAKLQPGDMLFFKTSTKSNHVGIYIGNRQFIHAPNRRSKVKITTMDN